MRCWPAYVALAGLLGCETPGSNLRKVVVEHDGWLHDRVDNSAAAHIKSALVGPSESIPLEDGRLALGRWQNVFFCEFDGPTAKRGVVVVVVS